MEPRARINRIIGQLNGIHLMLEKKRDCVDVLQQISAVKKAIDSLAQVITMGALQEKTQEKDRDQVRKIIANLTNI